MEKPIYIIKDPAKLMVEMLNRWCKPGEFEVSVDIGELAYYLPGIVDRIDSKPIPAEL